MRRSAADQRRRVRTALTSTQHLTHLETTGLLRLAQAQPELEYLFRHALVQEVAYESLSYARRREIHRAIGEELERAIARWSELEDMQQNHKA